MLKKCQNTIFFTNEKHEADDDLLPPSPPLPFPSTVYTLKTSPCMPAPRAHVENTCGRGASIHGVFSVSHTRHTTHHTPHHNPPQQHDHHTTRTREKRRREEERRRQENRREGERREKIRFQCGGAWPFLIDGVLCLVKPVNARFLSLLNRVKYGSSFDFFQCILAGQQFFLIVN